LSQLTESTSTLKQAPERETAAPVVPSRGVMLVLAIALAVFCAWITLDAWQDIVLLAWKDEQSSHVMAVPLAVAVLLLARRKRFATVKVQPHFIGCLMVAAGLFGWFWGYHNEIQIAWHGGAILAATGAFLSVMGVDVLRKFLPAIVVLGFLLPAPMTIRNHITMPMQSIAATATFSVCDVLGMGVTQAGQTLRINGQDVTVAEACAGMKMVFTLFLACFMSAYSLPLREPVRWLILLLAPLVAIVANVARLVPTLWAYGKFSPEAADFIHIWLGWGMVIVAFFALDGVAKLLDWLSLPVFKAQQGVAR
jgi:exosortase